MTPDPTLYERRPGLGVRRLESILAVLRSPGGCPWDREQTIASLKPCLIEEAYELLETMDGDDLDHHREELGDVLLQVVFQTQIRREQDAFGLDDVAHDVSDKLIRRHPHVFGDMIVEGSSDVIRNWEAIKRNEGRADGEAPRSPLAGVPASLPALLRAQRVQAKCAKAGFEWSSPHQARAKIDAALAEVDAAAVGADPETVAAEIGHLLFAIVCHARELGIDAESALRAATVRFTRRFQALEEIAREECADLHDLAETELLRRWAATKEETRDSP